MKNTHKELFPALWKGTHVELIDQLQLPHKTVMLKCRTVKNVADAIRTMKIRGAPAIGVAAAMGIALGVRRSRAKTPDELNKEFYEMCEMLAETRPTAVNLFWAIERMRHAFNQQTKNGMSRKEICRAMEREALKIFHDDVDGNKKMGGYGQKLFSRGEQILTHCNAGALATGGYGTALGVIRAAHEAGKNIFVYSCETRPYLQGARLTVFELKTLGIPHALICDNMAGHLMARGRIGAVITGADRIARNGDAANKIGTYALAVLADYHHIPFYIAAPLSTIDMSIPSGALIPIEERSPQEVTKIKNIEIAPSGTRALHPAFDVTPHTIISAIITERGIARKPFTPSFKKWFSQK